MASAATRLAVATSFDATQVVLCNPDRGTTVRDLATLAVAQRLPSTDRCSRHFPGDTGTARRGPKGQNLRRVGSFWHLFAADDRDLGELRDEVIRWRGDGDGAFAVVEGTLVALSSSGPRRSVALPALRTSARPIPDHRELVVVLGEHQVGIADPDTGRLRTRDGRPNGAITAIAFRGDTVITLADTVRVWRGGAMIENGPPVGQFAGRRLIATPATAPILAELASSRLALWTPGTGAPPIESTLGFRVDRDGDRYLEFGGGDPSDWSVRAGPLDGLTPIFHPWHEKPGWVDIGPLDAARGLIVMQKQETRYLITPAARRVVPIRLPCDSRAVELTHAHVASRLAAATARAVYLIDGDTGAVLASLAEPSPGKLVAFLAADDLALAAGGRLVLWGPGGARAARPKLRAPVTAIAVDRERGLVALGHGDGSIEVEPLAELRARATPTAVQPAGLHERPCTSPPGIATTIEELSQP
jgi:hypothetical protein